MRLALFFIVIIVGGLAVYAQLLSEQFNSTAESQRQMRSTIAHHTIASPT